MTEAKDVLCRYFEEEEVVFYTGENECEINIDNLTFIISYSIYKPSYDSESEGFDEDDYFLPSINEYKLDVISIVVYDELVETEYNVEINDQIIKTIKNNITLDDSYEYSEYPDNI